MKGSMLEYGAIRIDVGSGVEMWVELAIYETQAIEKFKAAAAGALGPDQPFEIRKGLPTNYGRTKSIGWVEGHHQAHVDAFGYVAEGGYRLVGKFTTPGVTPAPDVDPPEAVK